MATDEDIGFPLACADERELLLRWLRYLRSAVLRKVDGITGEQARWTPDGALIPLIGVVNHLTGVEWRWIDGGMRQEEVSRSAEEFRPGTELSLEAAIDAYRRRAQATDAYVLSAPSLEVRCHRGDDRNRDLRWVLLHLINETARHAGHADATRELLDGLTGE